MVSCGQKNQSSQSAKKDPIATNDSATILHRILKSVTDTLPEFRNAKLSRGTAVDSSNGFCGLFVYKGDSITAISLNDTLNGIEVLYYPNGNLKTVYRSYNKNEFLREKDYDANGKLVSEGLKFGKGEDIPIGKWIFPAVNGGKDSIVDHDGDYKISYTDAKQIAEKHGWPFSEISTSFYFDEKAEGGKTANGESVRTDFWEIVYNGKNNRNDNPTSILQINAHTGEEKFVKTATVRICH